MSGSAVLNERPRLKIRYESEIRQRLYTYCHAIDRVDAEELATVYHPDAVDEHGWFDGPADEYIAWVIGGLSHGGESQHLLGNIKIELDGDVAYVESYLIATMASAGGDGIKMHFLHGRYVDRFERRDGAWKIAHRTFIHDMDYTMPTVPDVVDVATHRGSRSKDDPSYQRANR